MLRLGGRVLWDMVLSNIEVARRILGPEADIPLAESMPGRLLISGSVRPACGPVSHTRMSR